MCASVLKFNLKLLISSLPELKNLHKEKQASNVFLRKPFQVVQGDGCLIIFFMNEVCYANEGDSQKERTWRPLLLLDCTDCSNPPPSTPAPQSVLFEGGAENAAWHFSS